MFDDLDWFLNASRGLSAIVELLVCWSFGRLVTRLLMLLSIFYIWTVEIYWIEEMHSETVCISNSVALIAAVMCRGKGCCFQQTDVVLCVCVCVCVRPFVDSLVSEREISTLSIVICCLCCEFRVYRSNHLLTAGPLSLIHNSLILPN